jgi:DNA polymerase-3 subunit gamma/tau
VTPQPVPTPAPAVDRVEATEVAPAATKVTPRRTATVKSAKTSVSINDLIGGKAKSATELAAEEAAATTNIKVDPDSEAKLQSAKPRYVEMLMGTRPRFGVIFETMKIVGNKISITVPSHDLGEEIMRATREWTGEIAEFAGVGGFIELEVIVNEKVKAARPITLEDRLRHLSGRNEHLRDMIDRLQLDAE